MAKEPESTLTRKTAEELEALAAGIVRNEIFTDRHIAPHDLRLTTIIFAPLGFMDRKQLLRLQRKERPGMMYAPISKAGPRGINGYPMFFELHMVHPEDAEIIWRRVTILLKAVS